MLDTDTFVTTLYVKIDDFCKEYFPEQRVKPGPEASLSCSEVVCLAIYGQWRRFQSESDFYRFAQECLRGYFPNLPDRSQYNRQARQHREVIVAVALQLSQQLGGCEVESLDCTAVATRDRHRRGNGWLCGMADIGYSSRLGWFEGFRLLIAVGAYGAITGFCFGNGSTNDRPLAEALLALRAHGSPRVSTAGRAARGAYVADKGFAGKAWQPGWLRNYGAAVIAQGQQSAWPKPARRWLAHVRQIVESVFEKLLNSFGLSRERPHQIDGFQMRLAAKVALHNFCIWLNLSLGRPPMATADLLGWT